MNEYREYAEKASVNVVDENIKKITNLFPEVLTDGTIDFNKLQQVLGLDLDNGDERYSFTWNGKKNAMKLGQLPTTATLLPQVDKSKDWNNTENLYIEGDNLEVLKLLQKSYAGQVKMIYLDPPYNTGHDFVYHDDFHDNLDNYLRITGQKNDEGDMTSTNSESSGRFHTDWLNMMYPRLRLARNLLSDDGSIFVSIDDHELNNLKRIMDEIFGESNFLAQIEVLSNPRGSQSSKHFSSVNEYILAYAKNESDFKLLGLQKNGEETSEYSEVDSDGRHYRLLGLRQRGGAWRKEERPKLHYPIYVNPNNGEISLDATPEFSVEVIPARPTGELGRWTWGREKVLSQKNEVIGVKVAGTDKWDIRRKDYLESAGGEVRRTKVSTLWLEKKFNYQNARNEIKDLFGNSEMFDYPKPKSIVMRLLEALDFQDEDIVMDFFSGSGTTADAVMSQNKKDGIHRRFIMVQLPEQLPESSQAAQAGYQTIPDVAIERISRAGKKLSENVDLLNEQNDTGFQVFTLGSTNIKSWDGGAQQNEQTALAFESENLVDGRTSEDVAYEILLKKGLDLTLPISRIEIDGGVIYDVAYGTLFIITGTNVTRSVSEKILKLRNQYQEQNLLVTSNIVFIDDSFKNSEEKLNTISRLHDAGYDPDEIESI
ncbi:site-specific DNA-methyltransferase [Lactiplantibacillus plantarum]|uniref:site-specific DNA-methyltransferase n=1 Tax=Lactiplantibacillus plantarum TaxID=1590 RepID=UPI0013D141B8|nr:site-specific DNA-methyltransferase [Lactiplantibacillus plantarum]